MSAQTAPLILLAEDEPNIAFSLSFILERAGFLVETSTDGDQVEKKAHAIRPDLLILDIMLPNKSGFDVLRGIRSNKTTQNLPVLMLSARGQSADMERARNLGANDYLTKPYSNAELVERVKTLLEAKDAPQKNG